MDATWDLPGTESRLGMGHGSLGMRQLEIVSAARNAKKREGADATAIC